MPGRTPNLTDVAWSIGWTCVGVFSAWHWLATAAYYHRRRIDSKSDSPALPDSLTRLQEIMLHSDQTKDNVHVQTTIEYADMARANEAATRIQQLSINLLVEADMVRLAYIT